jgi:hypothetical protein
MLDGWREVCRWEVTGDLPLSMETVDWRSAFEDMAAAFEDLAGEHRELVADNVHSRPECPGPGWYWVRGHWRSRSASSAPSVELCKTEVGGTDDTDDGPSGASEGQPEVFPPVSNPGQTLWQCEDCGQVVSRLDHDCEGAE